MESGAVVTNHISASAPLTSSNLDAYFCLQGEGFSTREHSVP